MAHCSDEELLQMEEEFQGLQSRFERLMDPQCLSSDEDLLATEGIDLNYLQARLDTLMDPQYLVDNPNHEEDRQILSYLDAVREGKEGVDPPAITLRTSARDELLFRFNLLLFDVDDVSTSTSRDSNTGVNLVQFNMRSETSLDNIVLTLKYVLDQ